MENRQFTGEQKEFLNIIRGCRRRMNAAQTWEKLAAALIVGAVFGLGFEAAAFILPFYYANLYAALAVGISAVTGLALAYRQRVSETAAALKIDRFGFEERVITAYEGLMRKSDPAPSPFLELQQADAIKRLRAGKDRIRIAVCPPPKKLLLCAGVLLGVLVLALVPSVMKERARELHEIRKESVEKQKEIEEVIEKLEEFASDELTEEQLANLQEMINSLQASSAELQQASTPKELAAAGQKLDYKYGNMSGQLADLAKSLQNGAAVSPSTVPDMKDLSEKLQSMGENQNNGTGGNGQNSGENTGQQGNGQNGGEGGNGQNNGENTGQQGDGQNNGDPDGDKHGQSGEEGDGENGGSQSGDGAGGGQDGDGQSGGSDGSGGQNGGQGGDGRGTGSANIERDYISVPNDIGNDETLTGQPGSPEYSETFQAQNGISWEGDHVSYDSVIGEYQQKAYEGISGGKYPSGMEDVIRDYFGSFNE